MRAYLIKNRRRLLLGLLALAVLMFFLPPLPAELKVLNSNSSLILTDQNDRPLRRNLSERDGVNSWVGLSELPPHLILAVLYAEDRRFYLHPGIDPLAIARASLDNLRTGRVVSGASTITQQLLRTLKPSQSRELPNKLAEAYWALRLEFRFRKDELLEAYLNRVAFGASVHGVEEAARYYFDKPASAVSLAEAAALAVVIRSPSSLDPFTIGGEEELKRWTSLLLSRLQADGHITSEQKERAIESDLELSTNPPPFLAPHFCDLLLGQQSSLRGRVSTSLDLELQQSIEGIVRNNLILLANQKVGNAAVAVLEVESGKLIALVGSGDFHRGRDGQHNAALSLRQPGSTIKPFTYALLLQGVGQSGYILPDLNLYVDSEQKSFVPQNYDRRFHGPVSARTALACSYNVPAVRALEIVGVGNLLELLQRLGLSDLTQPPDHYGLGLTLGDGSASLLQITNAYRALANGGKYSPYTLLNDGNTPEPREVIEPRIAYLVTDILADKNARIPSFGSPNALEFPFPCAVKTGTSKGYRDNWVIGYTPKHVVGVWVGNSDASPMENVSGITGAGPLFRDVMLTLGPGGEFSPPRGLEDRKVCSLSGLTPNPDCSSTVIELSLMEHRLEVCEVCTQEEGKAAFSFSPLYREWARTRGLKLSVKKESSDGRPSFVFPQSGDVFSIDPRVESSSQKVRFQVAGGSPPYRWEINGKPLSTTQESSLWWQLSPGTHSISVTDSQSRKSELPFEVLSVGLPHKSPSPAAQKS